MVNNEYYQKVNMACIIARMFIQCSNINGASYFFLISTADNSIHTVMTANTITYTIIRNTRRKRVSLSVKPDWMVQIRIPPYISDKTALSIAKGQEKWIRDKCEGMMHSEFYLPPHKFCAGEAFHYRGKQYILETIDGEGPPQTDDSSLIVPVPGRISPSFKPYFIRKNIEKWYHRKALYHLKKMTKIYSGHFQQNPPQVAIKNYTSRWGACFSDGRIYYNWKIILAPDDICRYVVVHELCHLQIPNHSRQFWQLVGDFIADWHQCRSWLRHNGHTLRL